VISGYFGCTRRVATAPVTVDTILVTAPKVARPETVEVAMPMPPETVFKATVETVKVVKPETIRVAVGPAQPTEMETVAAYTVEPTVPTTPAVPPETPRYEVPPGVKYRVQIGAFVKRENAEKMYDKARREFGAEVYLRYIPPFWKVHVGNCYSLTEAIGLRRTLRRLGYRGAFIVTVR